MKNVVFRVFSWKSANLNRMKHSTEMKHEARASLFVFYLSSWLQGRGAAALTEVDMLSSAAGNWFRI